MLLVLFDTAVKGSIIAVLKGQIKKQTNKKRTNMEEKALEKKKQRAE